MDCKTKSFFPMSNDDLLFNKEVSDNAKVLLAAMYRHKNNEGLVRKSKRELAVLSNVPTGSVIKCIDELIKYKFITKSTEQCKRGTYQIKYNINLNPDSSNFSNYTKLIYEMIGEYKNDIIIKFMQLSNLLKINNFNCEEKLYTTKTIIQSNWLTVADVAGVMIELDEAGLFQYKRDAKAIYDEEYNKINNNEEIKKEAESSTDSATQEIEKNNETKINHVNIIHELEQNITVKPAEEAEQIQQQKSVNPKELMTYFYTSIGGKCTNAGREAKLIKDLSQSFSASELLTGIKYIINLRHTNLLRLSYYMNDAIKLDKVKQEFDKEGTAAYLLKKHHNALKIKPNTSTIVNYTSKIQVVIDEYSYDEADKTIQHMINNNITNLNFIGSEVVNALANTKSNKFYDNPCMFDRDELYNARLDLVEASRTLSDIQEDYVDYGDAVTNMAIKIFKEGSFNSKYSHFGWAYKIQLPWTKELFMIAEESDKINSKPIANKLHEYIETVREELFGGQVCAK